MPELDTGNRKLLYALGRNARASFAELAKTTGLTQQTARYRTRALVRDGVITSFTAQINFNALGVTPQKILFKISRAGEQEIRQIIDFLVEHPLSIWVVQFDGPYDIGVTLCVHKPIELAEFLEEFYSRFGKFVRKRALTTNISRGSLARQYLLRGKTRKSSPLRQQEFEEPPSLDFTDRIILSLLGENARISAAEISQHLEEYSDEVRMLTPEAILKRIKRIEDGGLISQYTITVNPYSFGMVGYLVLFYMDYSNKRGVKEFFSYLETLPHAIHVLRAVGEWDLELNLEVPRIQVYREVLADITKKHYPVINDYATLLIAEVHKHNSTAAILSFEH